MKKVSIIICTMNRAEYLDRTLSSLYYLNYPEFEVIVIDGPSTDHTDEVLKKYEKDIKWYRYIEKNLSAARNVGISMSEGDYVAFIDDDAIPEPEWLDNMLAGFASEDVGAVSGSTYNYTGGAFECRELVQTRFLGEDKEAFDFPYSFKVTRTHGCNCIFDKAKLLEVGGFNEQYDYFADDVEPCFRLVDAGYRVKYCANAFMHHKCAPNSHRDERKIILNWTEIVKNHVYTIKSYEKICGKEIASEALIEAKEGRIRYIKSEYKNSNITKEEFDKCIETIKKGYDQGLKDAKRGYDLFIKQETLDKFRLPYKPFLAFSRNSENERRTIVYMSCTYPPYQNGGVGKYTRDLALQAVKKGHRVHVLTDSLDGNYTINFEDNIWVHFLPSKSYNEEQLKSNFTIDGFDPNAMSYTLIYNEELLKIQEKRNVDIVHASIWPCLHYHALRDPRFTCVTTLVTPVSQVLKGSNPAEQFVLNLERDLIDKSKYILADSNAIIEEIEKCSKVECRDRTKVLYLGLQDDSKIITSSGQSSSDIEILFVGRFEHRKGIDVMLDAIPEILDNYKNVRIRMIGVNRQIPDSKMTYKDKFISDYKNKYLDRVSFEGEVSEEILKQAYADCDIFVAPSRYESFGVIFLEAMMFAKPVIGCRAGSMPEVIDEGVNGLLAEPGDAESLKNCLSKFIQNKELRENMGKAGRARYESYFTDKIMANNCLQYYNEILENKQNKIKEFSK